MRFDFEAEVWVWQARPTEHWTLLSLPAEASEEIREAASAFPRGFRSVRVTATIGSTTWRTSIFPGSAAYVLPVKRAVRRAEGFEAGDTVAVRVELDV